MNLFNKKKKGFTIVELVIVIAVIAVLAAILIPTFVGLVNKANVAADDSLVRDLNNALAIDREVNGKHETMDDALRVTDDYGFNVQRINAKANKSEILWDSVNDVFCYFDGDDVKYIPEAPKKEDLDGDYQYFVIRDVDNNHPLDPNYSTYLRSYSGDGVLTTDKGLDVGNVTTVTSVTYNGGTNAQNVVIRTNGGTLIINDTNPDSEQVHYGTLSSAEVTTGTSCFKTHGTIGTMDLKAGKAIADKGGYVGLIKAAEGTQVVEQNGGVFVIPSNATTADIPESVATQLSGYSVSDDAIVADATREANSFYGIGSLEQLKAFRDGWNNGTITITKVKLTADFDLSENNWYPIGTWEYPWFGTFDGNGHTINGLNANSTDAEHQGLYANGDSVGFGETYGFFGIVGNGDATISNVSFTNVNINIYNGKDVGAVIGYIPSLNKFKAANATGSDHFISTDKWTNDSGVGSHNVTLSGVTVSGSVKGNSHVGGLIGKIYSGGETVVTGCSFDGDVSASGTNAAGLVGYINPEGHTRGDGQENEPLNYHVKVTNNTVKGDISCTSTAASTACKDAVVIAYTLDFVVGGNDVSEANVVNSGVNATITYTFDSEGNATSLVVDGTPCCFVFAGATIKNYSGNATLVLIGGNNRIENCNLSLSPSAKIYGGTVTFGSGNSYKEIKIMDNASNVQINDAVGTYISNFGANTTCNNCSPTVEFSCSKGSIVLNNCAGKLHFGKKITNNIYATTGDAQIEVNSGTYTKELDNTGNGFTSTLTIKGGTFEFDPTSYVDTNNYNVTDNGNGTWTVSAK